MLLIFMTCSGLPSVAEKDLFSAPVFLKQWIRNCRSRCQQDWVYMAALKNYLIFRIELQPTINFFLGIYHLAITRPGVHLDP